MRYILLIISFCIIGSGCKSELDKTVDAQDVFKWTLIRANAPNPRVAGNSLEGIKASQTQGYRHIEVDFSISKDNILITAHDDKTRGCGKVSLKNANDLELCALTNGTHMTRLSKILSQDFDTIMLDIKSAKNKTFERSVDGAIMAIEDANAQDRVIVFVYGNDGKITEKLRKASIPFGYKGYPKKNTRQKFYEDAAKMKAEYICVQTSGVEIGDYLGRFFFLGLKLTKNNGDKRFFPRTEKFNCLVV